MIAASLALLFFLVHPLFVIVGYVPTLVVAAICIYIGIDFLWDHLVVPGLSVRAAASWVVLSICLYNDMLTGVVVGMIGFQAVAFIAPDVWTPANPKPGGVRPSARPAKATPQKQPPKAKSPSRSKSPPRTRSKRAKAK